jgi:hypothetical protein
VAALPLGHQLDDTIDLSSWDGGPRSSALDRWLSEIARCVGREPTPQFAPLREYENTWRRFGAPTLAQFALGKAAHEH